MRSSPACDPFSSPDPPHSPMTFSASCGFFLASRCFRLMKRAWVIAVAIAAASPASAASPERERPFLFGADVSALATYEAHGAVYRRHGAPGDALSGSVPQPDRAARATTASPGTRRVRSNTEGLSDDARSRC